MFWERPQLTACEQTPAVCTKSRSRGDTLRGASVKPRLSQHRIQTLRRVWGDVVQKYSSSELSFSRDKPIATAGIVQELRTRLDDIYLAVLWRKDIHKQLCWRWKDHEDYVGANNRADQKSAPTWSWLSVGGAVVPDANYYEDEDCGTHYFVEILDAVVNTSHPSGLPGFLSGTLGIRGLCVSLSYSDCLTWDNQRNGALIPINIFWDEWERKLSDDEIWRAKQQTPCRAEAELVFLIVNGKLDHDGYDFLEGLVLAPGRDDAFQ